MLCQVNLKLRALGNLGPDSASGRRAGSWGADERGVGVVVLKLRAQAIVKTRIFWGMEKIQGSVVGLASVYCCRCRFGVVRGSAA